MWLVSSSAVAGNLPFRLKPGDYVVGRTKSAQIIIADPTVSRRHAKLACTRNSLTIEDFDSSNGTFVNDLPVSKSDLQVGDHVRFGGVACLISASPLDLKTVAETESTHQIPHPRLPGETTQIRRFTLAQQEIIPLLMAGRSETEIASILGKSRHTIHTHIRAIFERMHVHSREELIVALMKHT